MTDCEKRVLVVDDNYLNIRVATGFLDALHVAYDYCDSGSKAIEMVKNHNYCLIFLDHMMPQMDGIETLKHIRALDVEYAKDIPVIAITANADVGVGEFYASNGFTDYLFKPIMFDQIKDMINMYALDDIKAETIVETSDIDYNDAQNEDSFERCDSKVITAFSQFGFNIDSAKNFTNNNIEYYMNYIAKFAVMDKEYIRRLKKYLGELDSERYYLNISKLKKIAKNIGADSLYNQIYKHEMRAKRKDMEWINENWYRFEIVWNKTIKDINEILNIYNGD